jgi:hypothetical protein
MLSLCPEGQYHPLSDVGFLTAAPNFSIKFSYRYSCTNKPSTAVLNLVVLCPMLKGQYLHALLYVSSVCVSDQRQN